MASKLITTGKMGKGGSFVRNMPSAVQSEISTALHEVARTMQQSAAARAPVHKGRLRRALLSTGAIGRKSRGMVVEFGLRTKSLQRKAFYAPFVEYGTKAYTQGAFRLRGVNRQGLGRYRKMKVNVPARPARPFFRPAVQVNIPHWRREMRLAMQRALRRAGLGK